MTAQTLAWVYAAAAALPTAMQIGLAAGAPWGRYTVGGRFDGRLPPLWRGLAVVQALLLGAMAVVVLGYAGALPTPLPRAAIWPVLGLTALTTLGNVMTPSLPERRLWAPVTLVMLVSLCAILALGPAA